MENQLLVTLNVGDLKGLINESVLTAIAKAHQQVEDETILRRKDVAKLLSVSLVTISDWMKSGKLPYHRINSRVFFKKTEVMKCMEVKGSKRTKTLEK